jgi:hypothetical protein
MRGSRRCSHAASRIGHLPPEVREVLAGTKIADCQDLLVALSDKIEEAATPEERLQLARDLVASPPKHGPRTTPKAAPAAPVAEPVEAGPAEGSWSSRACPLG